MLALHCKKTEAVDLKAPIWQYISDTYSPQQVRPDVPTAREAMSTACAVWVVLIVWLIVATNSPFVPWRLGIRQHRLGAVFLDIPGPAMSTSIPELGCVPLGDKPVCRRLLLLRHKHTPLCSGRSMLGCLVHSHRDQKKYTGWVSMNYTDCLIVRHWWPCPFGLEESLDHHTPHRPSQPLLLQQRIPQIVMCRGCFGSVRNSLLCILKRLSDSLHARVDKSFD